VRLSEQFQNPSENWLDQSEAMMAILNSNFGMVDKGHLFCVTLISMINEDGLIIYYKSSLIIFLSIL